jgi:hypothetical protein
MRMVVRVPILRYLGLNNYEYNQLVENRASAIAFVDCTLKISNQHILDFE